MVTRLERFCLAFAACLLGALYGVLAGLEWSRRQPVANEPESLTDVVIHRYANAMRESATSN